MAIRGTIQADYSKYVDECAKAEAGLAKIESQGKSTESSLVAMEKSVSEGGISKAIEKTVVSVDKAEKSARASATGFGQMSEGLRNADKVLNQFGVNLGPTISSLDEMSKISGQTAGQLGVLGSAVAVAGAAVAGWNIGRWIADLTGADEKIADLASSMMGGGTVAAQTYAAQLDAVHKAIMQGYVGIPTYTQAIEYNAKVQKDAAAQLVTSAGRIQEWERDIRSARGGSAELRKEIEAGNLTQAELVARFDVSSKAIDYLRKQIDLAKDATEKKAQADKKAAAEAQAHADAMKKLRDQMFGADAIEKSRQYIEALGSTNNLTRMNREAQAALNTTLGEAIESYKRAGEVAPQAMRDLYLATIQLPPVVKGLGSEFANVGQQVTITADKVVADLGRIKTETAAYDAQTRAMVDAYVAMQYGADGAEKEIDQTTAAQGRLTVAMRDFGTAAASAYERAIAGAQLFKAYQDAGVATSGGIGLGGYQFKQLQQTGVPGGLASPLFANNATPGASQPWGNQNNININVNNADAGQLAERLVGEMKHSGYRL